MFWAEAARTGPPYWTDGRQAAEELMAASLRQLEAWGVRRQYADGELPVHGVYGVPQQWAHVRSLYERAGFVHDGHVELVYLALISDLRRPGAALPRLSAPSRPAASSRPAAPSELSVRRSVGINGTRLSAVLGDDVLGYIEAEIFDDGERHARHGGWADIGNLYVARSCRRQGIATWLLGEMAEWLHLAHVDRLLAYTYLEGRDEAGQDYDEERAFLRASPFTELTQTARGWTRDKDARPQTG